MAGERSYTQGRFSVDVDGANVGYLKSISGVGTLEAEIATHDLGPDKQQKKHVANTKWAPAKCEIGIGMGKSMYDWMKGSLDKKHIQKNGAVHLGDFDHKAMQSITWYGGLITEVTVPKMSGDSKDAAYFTVGFEYEYAEWAKGGGESISAKMGPKQKNWLCSNYKLEIGGLPCERVASIDSFSWKCTTKKDEVGSTASHRQTLHPAKITIPDLKLSISSADKTIWADAARAWFVGGNHGEAQEMTGRLVFLGPNMKDELGEINFMNVGFKKFAGSDLKGGDESVARFNVELYCEQMEFKIKEFDQ